eukprot:TRINITY_DN2343_c0_g1_i1.p1 TRINITY_DN2343_c0_g1~~TRINITY_DN2343_c0_g1_i1.p1  ORF type:complete len:154 (-),score=27.13 TRINITY_DN2343_c0_g1_i1:85-546(-)
MAVLTSNFAKILQVLSILCCLAIAVTGVMAFAAYSGSLRLITAIQGIYMLIFGTLGIFAELRWKKLLSAFSFLNYYVGRGGYFVFIGTLSLRDGDDYLTFMIVGFIMIANGVFNIFVGCCIFEHKYGPGGEPGAAGGARDSGNSGKPSDNSAI